MGKKAKAPDLKFRKAMPRTSAYRLADREGLYLLGGATCDRPTLQPGTSRGLPPPARGEFKNKQSKLLETTDGKRLDPGAESTAGGADKGNRRPWERSTGPRVAGGKVRLARNAFKRATRPMLKKLRNLLRQQNIEKCPLVDFGTERVGSHERVIRRLTAYLESKEARKASYILSDMRTKREGADYELSGGVTVEDAAQAIVTAEKVRALLQDIKVWNPV